MFRDEVIRDDTRGVMAAQTGHMFLTVDSMTTQDGRGLRPLFWKGLK
jgi:hypothetical protein